MDLISRQAVLDLIAVWAYDLCYKEDEWRAAEEIENLPSAQPEIVRCKDCEFYTEEERWCRRLGLCGAFDQDGYCSHAERLEE